MSWVSVSCGIRAVEGGAGAVARFVGHGARAGLVAGDEGAFGQGTDRDGGSCSHSLRLSKGCGGGLRTHPVPVTAPLAPVAGHFTPSSPCHRSCRAVEQGADTVGDERSAMLGLAWWKTFLTFCAHRWAAFNADACRLFGTQPQGADADAGQ